MKTINSFPLKKIDPDLARKTLQRSLQESQQKYVEMMQLRSFIEKTWNMILQSFNKSFDIVFMDSIEMIEKGLQPSLFSALCAYDGNHIVVVNLKKISDIYRYTHDLETGCHVSLLHEMGHCLVYSEEGYIDDTPNRNSMWQYYNSPSEKAANEKVGLTTSDMIQIAQLFTWSER